MNHRLLTRLLSATAAVAASMVLSACGGGSGSPPPSAPAVAADTSAPVVTITKSANDAVATGPVTFTFSFNKDVGTSFTADDVTVTGGTKGAFTRSSGTSATLVVTPTPNAAGTMQVSIAAGAVTDAFGNTSAAASSQQAFNTVVQTVLVNFSEATPPALAGFGGAEDATVVTDPTDATNKVARIVKSATAELWAGTTVSICPSQAIVALPFTSTLTTLTARVWSPAAGVPVRMKVESAADGTKSVETEATTTVANAWQTLSFNFANPATGTAALNLANTYDKLSVFFNFGTAGAATGARTYYLDDLAFRGSAFSVACSGTGGTATTSITMDEMPPPALAGFGGAEDSTIVTDPAGGTNKVAKVVKSATAELWAGTTVSNLANAAIAPIGFTASNTTITVRVWSPTAGTPVRLKVENATDGSKSVETEATTTAANAWQTLSFDFSKQAAGTAALNLATTYNKASIFFNFGTTGAAAGGARTYYFENVTYPTVGGSSGGATASNVVIDMESATAPVLTGFGGAEDSTVVADPAGGTNKVVKVVKSGTAELWAGTTISNLPNFAVAPIGFSASKTTITVRVWSPTAGTPVRLKVENAADGSKSVETEATTTVANAWQTLSFDFSKQAAGTAALNLATTYNKASIFFNFGTTGAAAGGARTYYFDDITYPAVGGSSGGVTAKNAVIDMESTPAPVLTGFGGAEDSTVVADPAGGTNKVAKVVKSGTAELWAGTTVSNLPNFAVAPIGFTASNTTITVRVWSPTAGTPVRLKVESATDGSKSVETEATTTAANAWQTLSFDFSKQAAGTAALNLATTYNKISIFFNFGTTGAAAGGARTYYFDDITYPAVP